jgi:hypothetical protein
MYNKGQRVRWKWGANTATGEVQEHFTRDVTRTLQGSEITRHGSKDNPAYLIKQEDGDRVLKLESELQKA